MKTFTSINPYTLEKIAEYKLMNDAAIEEKSAKSEVIFKDWRKRSFEHRAALMMKVAENLLQQKKELALLITSEMGKVTKEAIAEIEKCAGACKYYADHAEEFLKNIPQPSDASKSYVRHEPVGAVLAIMPWNFPFWQVFRFAAPYLMAGNVALLKHAPNVCGTSLAIEKIFIESGFPEGVFQSLIIDVDRIEAVLSHNIIQGATLTGSELAGSSLAAIAGKLIKKSVLELGGSDAFIILEDADLKKAAQTATLSRMQNAGQSCIAAKRFIAVKKIKDEFAELFKKEIEKLKQGNPLDENITTGPLARLDLAEKLDKQLKQSLNKGATLISGGGRDNCNFQPVLLSGVQKNMSAYDEETFGPLAALIEAKDEDDAVRIANDSRYSLGSSLWTNDLEKAERIVPEINAGAVFINAMVKSDARYPFGGIKKSGYGRELSHFGIHEFMNAKTVFIN